MDQDKAISYMKGKPFGFLRLNEELNTKVLGNEHGPRPDFGAQLNEKEEKQIAKLVAKFGLKSSSSGEPGFDDIVAKAIGHAWGKSGQTAKRVYHKVTKRDSRQQQQPPQVPGAPAVSSDEPNNNQSFTLAEEPQEPEDNAYALMLERSH